MPTHRSRLSKWLISGPGIALIIFILGAIGAILTRPEIRFSLKPVTVKEGERVTLEWEVRKARRVEIIPEIGVVDSVGGRTAQPNKTTVYTLIASGFLFTEKASYEVIVNPTTSSEQAKIGKVDFAKFRNNVFLAGDDFIADGIEKIRAAPEADYCRDAQPAILQAGTYKAPYSFLTTAKPGKPIACNTVKLDIVFVRPTKQVVIRFNGADRPYVLEGYTKDGSLIVNTTKNANPYDYQDYEIGLLSPQANIAWVRFGYEAALTMIRDIEFNH